MEILHLNGAAPYYTNTFLVIGSDKNAIVIDPAATASEYEKLLKEHNANLTHILLTHGHHDHAVSVKELKQKYNATVHLGETDRKGDRLFPLTDSDCNVGYTDGEIITAGNEISLKVITTPGHSEGCVCLLLENSGIMFTGDTLFDGEIGRCDLDGGSYKTMLESLAKLRDTVVEDVQVLPGHGSFSSMDKERKYNEYMKQA